MKRRYFKIVVSLAIITLLSQYALTAQDVNHSSSEENSAVSKNLAKNSEYFSKGLECKFQNDLGCAIDNFQKALQESPDDHASMFELSLLYRTRGQYEEGFELIKKACELDTINKWYKIQLAKFYKQQFDYESFINIYDKLLDEEPDNLEYLEAYIDAYSKIGDYEKLSDKLNEIEKKIGINEFISLSKINIYSYTGDNASVLMEMEKLSNAFPYEPRYMLMLAEAYMKEKRDKDALPLYLKVKQQNPEDPYINISLLEYYQKQGELDKAFDEFILSIKNKELDYKTKTQIYEFWFEGKENDENITEQAKEVAEAFLETHPDKEIGYYIKGTIYYNEENYEKAQEYYLNSIQKDSTSFTSWVKLAFTDIELQDYENLYKHSATALRIYPEYAVFYLFNGAALTEKEQYEEAIKMYEKGRMMSPNIEMTLDFDTYISDIYNILGEKEKMYRQYDKILKYDPENVYVLNNYAYFLSLDNVRLEEALKMSAITINKEPKNATYLDTYAWVLYKLGRYKEAKKWMEKALDYEDYPQGTYYEHYGDILYQLGDTKKAVQNWKKAKKLGDTSEFIDMKIKDEKLYE